MASSATVRTVADDPEPIPSLAGRFVAALRTWSGLSGRLSRPQAPRPCQSAAFPRPVRRSSAPPPEAFLDLAEEMLDLADEALAQAEAEARTSARPPGPLLGRLNAEIRATRDPARLRDLCAAKRDLLDEIGAREAG